MNNPDDIIKDPKASLEERIEAFFSRGFARYNLGNYNEAMYDFDKAIELNPDFAEAYCHRGLVQHNLGRYSEAIADFDKAIELFDKDGNTEHEAYAYCNRGNSKANLGKYSEAIEDYDKAIKFKPDFAQAYRNRGLAQYNLGKYNEAIEDYDKAIKLFNRAIELFNKAIELFNKDGDTEHEAHTYNNRGNVKEDLKRYSEAREDYDKAIELFNKTGNTEHEAQAYRNRGNVKEDLKRYSEAIKDFDKAITLKPDFAEAYYLRGNSKYNLGNTYEYETDKKAIEEAKKQSPKNSYEYYCKVRTEKKIAKHEEAIEDYDKAIELKPNFAEAYSNRGLAQHNLGRYEDAIKDYDKAIELNPDFAEAYYRRASLRGTLNKYEDVIKDCTKMIDFNYRLERAYYWKGLSNSYLGKYEEAIKDFTRNIQEAEKISFLVNTGYYQRGLAQYRLGKYGKATEDFDKAIELNPDLDIALLHLITGVKHLNEQEYLKAIDSFNASLQYGIRDEFIELYKKKKSKTKENIAESIVSVFQNTAKILNALKVEKNTSDAKKKKDTMDYLSHTTRLSVLTRQLLPIEDAQIPKKVQKFRLHHIAYANDPTEGTALFKTLAIEPQYTEHAGTIPYIMIASFSAGKSPEALDRLPIWNMYGDDARGISLLFKTQDIASDERGHVGSSPAPEKEVLKKLSYKREEHTVATAMPKTKNEKDTKPPPQILYRVHYMGKDDDEGNAINTLIQAVKKDLKAIKNLSKTLGEEGASLYGKTLVLLEGLRYLIKDKSYEYENEYRLLCVCTGEHIPDVLKCSDADTEAQDDAPRVYVETDLAEKLCAVMTGPKVRDPERVAIQYRLHAYKDVLPKLEERTIWRSDIPYT